MKPGHFTVLDSWRGIAACVVALYHLKAISHVYDWSFIRNGWIFVDFFFVLSGFVIANAYFSRLSDGRNVVRFMVTRFGRLYPLHVVVLLFTLAVEVTKLILAKGGGFDHAPFSGGHSLAALIPNLLLIQALLPLPLPAWNEASWSISIEFWVYIIFAALIVATRRSKRAMAALFAAAYVVLIAHVMQEIEIPLTLVCEGLSEFLAGAFTWMAYVALKQRGDRAPFGIASALEILALIAFFAFVSASGHARITVAAPIFSTIILIFAFEKGAISKFLRGKVFTYLGETSYSIYMVHGLIAVVAYVALGKLAPMLLGVSMLEQRPDGLFFAMNPFAGDLFYAGYLAVVIALSGVTYRFIEAPARSYFKRIAESRLGRPQAMPAGAAPVQAE